jgi:tRNA threonylcarbamoyladenosine modification (KEOPS) complex  Pcc1 subunit
MRGPAVWTGEIELHSSSGVEAEWLYRALRPEAEREVPRARATVARTEPDKVRVEITAQDTGALRAALNTYLGWIDLAQATLGAAPASPADRR